MQVGGFTIFRNEDLGAVLPMWIKYTEDVREDPDVSLISPATPCTAGKARCTQSICRSVSECNVHVQGWHRRLYDPCVPTI